MQNTIPPTTPPARARSQDIAGATQDAATGSTGATGAATDPAMQFGGMPPRPGGTRSSAALHDARATARTVTTPLRHDAGFEDTLKHWYNGGGDGESTSSSRMDKNTAVHRITAAYGQQATVLDLNALQLKTLPECLAALAGLRTLLVRNNQLRRLPALPPALERLVADCNLLDELPALPATVQAINVNKNQLTALPELPAALESLRADVNHLALLPELPAGLLELHAENNRLLAVPTLPPGIKRVHLSINQLTALPPLPSSLIFLGVSSNRLAELPPVLPADLEIIDLEDNELSALPTLPAGLKEFYAQNNHLNSLPALPTGLTHFQVGQNRLRELPGIPAGIGNLDVEDNLLTVLPDLPAGLENLTADPGVVTGSITRLQQKVAHQRHEDQLRSLLAPDPIVPKPQGVGALEGFARLPSEVIEIIAAHFTPGATDVTNLAVTNSHLLAALQAPVERDKAAWLAKAEQQIAILQRLA